MIGGGLFDTLCIREHMMMCAAARHADLLARLPRCSVSHQDIQVCGRCSPVVGAADRHRRQDHRVLCLLSRAPEHFSGNSLLLYFLTSLFSFMEMLKARLCVFQRG